MEKENLEPAPSQLKLATVNNAGLSTEDAVRKLGFVIQDYTRNNEFFIVATPPRIMERVWKISYQNKNIDPLLFTIHLTHGEVGVLDFLKQMKIKEKYILYMP